MSAAHICSIYDIDRPYDFRELNCAYSLRGLTLGFSDAQ